MDQITHEELCDLAEPGSGPCVTIYLPLAHGYPEARQNPARLRVALERAEQRLREFAQPLPEGAKLADLTAPAWGLVEREEFWRGCGAASLAVLLAPGFSRFLLLPFACPESVDVGRTFRLAPLARLAAWPDEYHLLALSMNAARLYHGTRGALAPVELPKGTPASLAEYTAGIEVGPAARYLTTAGGPRSGGAGFVHGGASDIDDAETRRQEYVQAVAKAVAARKPHPTRVPLVLAAAEELHPIFRAAYPASDLVEPGLFGCPDHLGEAELREGATRIVEARPDGAFAATRDRYLRAKGKSEDAIEAIVPAAAEGRVDSLILAFGGRIWGERHNGNEVRALAAGPEGPPKSEDLTEVALQETLRHGGRVFAVPREEVPGEGTLAAVLRW